MNKSLKLLWASIGLLLLLSTPKLSFAAASPGQWAAAVPIASESCITATAAAAASDTATFAGVAAQFGYLTLVSFSSGPTVTVATGVATITGLAGGTISINLTEAVATEVLEARRPKEPEPNPTDPDWYGLGYI